MFDGQVLARTQGTRAFERLTVPPRAAGG